LKALEARLAQQPGAVLTESQVRALEKAQQEKEAHGEIETAHPGYLGVQDTYYVGTIKSIGRIYQQTFVDTYSKVACAKLYDRKNALVAADLLNDTVLPFFYEQNVPLLRILTDIRRQLIIERRIHGVPEQFQSRIRPEGNSALHDQAPSLSTMTSKLSNLWPSMVRIQRKKVVRSSSLNSAV
jgi:hypothetical protein